VSQHRDNREPGEASRTDTIDSAIFDWDGLLGLPAFERIACKDLEAAFQVAMDADRAEIDAFSAEPAATAELDALLHRTEAEDVDTAIAPREWAFHAEKVRHDRFALDPAELAPHFSLEAMIAAAFDVAHRPNPDAMLRDRGLSARPDPRHRR